MDGNVSHSFTISGPSCWLRDRRAAHSRELQGNNPEQRPPHGAVKARNQRLFIRSKAKGKAHARFTDKAFKEKATIALAGKAHSKHNAIQLFAPLCGAGLLFLTSPCGERRSERSRSSGGQRGTRRQRDGRGSGERG